MEVTWIHVDSTKMTTLKEGVNIVEEDVIRIHIDHSFIVEHIPHVKLVESIFKVILV